MRYFKCAKFHSVHAIIKSYNIYSIHTYCHAILVTTCVSTLKISMHAVFQLFHAFP